MEIEGRTALVTGANRGIGLAITKALAAEGARVLAGVRELDPEHRVEVEGVREVHMDLSSPQSIEACVDELGDLAQIDVLVNNAGVFTGGLLETQDMWKIIELLQTNLAAPILLTKALLPAMLHRDTGKIVNNASIVGHAPFPGASTYAASKTGLTGFTEALRRELAETGLSVLELVTPGVDTDMMDQVQRELEGHTDTSGWDHVDPDDWAEKVVKAIRSDEERLDPGGAERLAQVMPKALLDFGVKRRFERSPA